MPADSQALARLIEDRAAAVARLQVIDEHLAAAQQAVVRWTTSQTTVTDEVADLDAAIAREAAAP